jgi:hypothetical protein
MPIDLQPCDPGLQRRRQAALAQGEVASGPWCKRATGVGSLEPPSMREDLHPWHDELFGSDHDLTSILEDVARLSVRLVFQTALEAEVEEFLGRARYERRGDADRPGSRNGHQPPRTVKTTMGAVELQRPKLRGTEQVFCSRLFGAG